MSPEPSEPRPSDQSDPPLRIPKLTYRNRVPVTDDSVSQTNDSSSSEQKFAQSDIKPEVAASVNSQPPTRALSDISLYNESGRGSASAAVSHADALVKGGGSKRKTHNSLLGFFSLKEPSSSALQDFARQEHRYAAAKGGRLTPVGMPGISTQKLPSTVPKVNSKWNGLPLPAKDKPQQTRSSRRDSAFTVKSHASTSTSSSKMSSRSMNSDSSSRLRSPFVPSSGELPDPSTSDLHTTGQNPKLEKHGTTEARQLLPSDVGRTGKETIPSQADMSSGFQKPRSDSVAEPTASAKTFLATCSNEPKCAYPLAPHEAPSIPATSIEKPVNTGQRAHSGTSTADVLPWEVQSPPPEPPLSPRRDEERKRKLAFLPWKRCKITCSAHPNDESDVMSS